MLAFFQIYFGQIFFDALTRRMVLVGPRKLAAHAEWGCFDSEGADLWGGGEKYAYGVVALSHHFDLDVGFF